MLHSENRIDKSIKLTTLLLLKKYTTLQVSGGVYYSIVAILTKTKVPLIYCKHFPQSL